MTYNSFIAALTRPDVLPVLIFLGALAAHVAVGALLHLLRLHDFDFHQLGRFVETDLASKRGLAIATSFLITVATTQVAGGDWRTAYVPAWLSLVAACGAATLSILRDTIYELVQLVSGKVYGAKAIRVRLPNRIGTMGATVAPLAPTTMARPEPFEDKTMGEQG